MPSKIKKSLKKSKLSKYSNLNLSKDMHSINPLLYSILGVTLISIAYVSAIIYYLNSLKSCKCFQEKNKNNYSNLTFLIIIESIILTMNIILALGTIYLGIYGYFIYNVYKIYENIDPNCDCTENWLRYLLYIQAVLMLVNVLLIVAKVVS